MPDALAAWRLLWQLAQGDEETGRATIETCDREDEAELVWLDGSRSVLRWERGGWEFLGALDTAPCDVAARDSLL